MFTRRKLDDLGCQPITVFKTIGHQIADVASTHGAQRAQRERGAGRAIGIEIADYEDATATCHHFCYQSDGGGAATKSRGGQQSLQRIIEQSRRGDATRG